MSRPERAHELPAGAGPPPGPTAPVDGRAGGRSSVRAGGRTGGRAAESWPHVALVVLGLVSLVLYHVGLRVQGTGTSAIVWFMKLAFVQGALYLVAGWLVCRARPARSTLGLVVLFAALFRLSVLAAPPLLSDDMYRYVWDGRVQAAGTNPYRYVPADPALAPLRDAAIYEHINRRDYAPTIYPPGAQIFYLLTTRVSESLTWMKFVFVCCEAVGLWAVAALLASFGLPRQRVLLAAWHPLLVWEIASSGHVDALVVALVALALLAHRRGRARLTGLALAAATLVKLFPVALLPALYRRWGWRLPLVFGVTIVVAYVPYVRVGLARVVGFLPGYANEEGLQNGVRFFILSLVRKLPGAANVPNGAFIVGAGALLLALALWCWLAPARDAQSYVRRAGALAAAFTVLLSPRYSWYFVWLVPYLCFDLRRWFAPLLYLTLASFILYGSWLGDAPPRMFMLQAWLYLPAAGLALLMAGVRWLRPNGRAPELAGEKL